jgi:NTP pyrophosphatase (non-canonical NTP hydrolase)
MEVFSMIAVAGIQARILRANARYGPFTSTHEALGVCSEEWDELREAIRSNNLAQIKHEALDLAAALIRLHDGLKDGTAMAQRSVK